MEDLTKIPPNKLLIRLKNASAEERRLQMDIIRLLAEVDRRRLYAFRGYRSLFDFCVRELGYSDAAAWRRISAMRLLKEIPQAEERLASGKVNLSQVTSIQNFLYSQTRNAHRTFSAEQKLELLTAVENKSARETERVLAAISPSIPISERERSLNANETEIRFVADSPLKSKLDRLKDLNSHRDPSRSYSKLFDWLSDLGIEEIDPSAKTPNASVEGITRNGRYIPVSLRRAVWSRDGGRCTFRNPETQRICGSMRFLEVDHIQPIGLGGLTTLDNLRLYCRTHNQSAAMETYGEAKIAQEIALSARAQNKS